MLDRPAAIALETTSSTLSMRFVSRDMPEKQTFTNQYSMYRSHTFIHDYTLEMKMYVHVTTDRLFEAVVSIAPLKHLLDNILHLRVDNYLLRGRIICSRITTSSEYTRAFTCTLFLLPPQRFVLVYALG
jgi:hypothetical protein